MFRCPPEQTYFVNMYVSGLRSLSSYRLLYQKLVFKVKNKIAFKVIYLNILLVRKDMTC